MSKNPTHGGSFLQLIIKVLKIMLAEGILQHNGSNYIILKVKTNVHIVDAEFILSKAIWITHVFSCINICWVPRKLFEHEAVRPSV